MVVCARCGNELAPPYAFCSRCGSPQHGAPGVYWPHPPYSPRPAPPNQALLVVLVVILIVASVALPWLLYIMVSGLIGTGLPSKPVVTFSSVTVTSTSASFSVASSVPAVSLANYKMILQLNGVAMASAVPLGAGNHTVTVGSTAFYLLYLDMAVPGMSGYGNLKSGDTLRIGLSNGGNLPPGSYAFVLIWAGDGSAYPAVTWSA